MGIKGRRAAATQVAEPPPNEVSMGQPTWPYVIVWKVGDRVQVDFEGTMYGGRIVSINQKQHIAVVGFDDGDKREIDLTALIKPIKELPDRTVDETLDESEEVEEADCETQVMQEADGDVVFNPPKKGTRGMHHYPVHWAKDGLTFNVWAAPDRNDLAISGSGDEMIETLGDRMVHFFGFWRKTRFARVNDDGKVLRENITGWSIDIRARIEGRGDEQTHEYLVESIRYEQGPDQGDPRVNMHSLNSDICAAIRKWFFTELKGDRETVTQLRKRADNPIISVPSLQWLDTFLLKAREVRDTALASGGQRMIVIDSGVDGEPVVSLALNFTDLAVALDGGRVPNLYAGTMHEHTTKTGGRKGTRAPQLEIKADPANVAALSARVKELNAKAKQGDLAAKAEARKIRAAMRRMGVKGGARSAATEEGADDAE